MSSTQHQLIEQCVTRLRGIVDALDNIHDNTPHRWSTDLDHVHSSAESLLAMIKGQAPARSEASFEEWLANELEGEDGQPVPAAVCDIALARRAFNHWPKLEQPAKVGGVRFSAGVSSRLVVEAAQRLYEFESTPEKEAERIERLQAFREQLDPLNLAPHAEAFNEAPAEALRPEQAEAERPEVVAWQYRVTAGPQTGWSLWHPGKGEEFERSYTVERRPLMTIAQHECIVGELRAVIAQLRQHKNDYMDSGQETYRALQNEIREREAEIARLDGLVSGRMAERDAALARVAEVEAKLADLEKQEPFYYFADCDDTDHSGLHNTLGDALTQVADHGGSVVELYRKPPAQAQHSAPEVSGIGRDTGHPRAVVLYLRKEPTDDDLRAIHDALRSLAAAPGKEVPQAWLDVQAERRRQITAEGWTPEHDDAHSHGEMARAAACYALAGSSAPNDGTAALLVSLAWPWDEQWWKPTSARRDLVKACALALAEIERLDRAGISQNPQPGATTASS
ncbi:hypothetical protein [Pseudomonas aeruginosa]|uniref:hypothetical protein n=1 Tax=Pseudomonas aeruginosa TaxID=287 RepID=UPI0021E3060A|nr:hypothetical protein [Pseudomonas aeruginosa]MDY1482858.1 hypothetical protein [Pseudomonas aeruginosa]MDY1495300.1 hypothetical protein [Pseudomonas aeruginosa]MDY1556373.1 hypothetical protein [Pseudomonas aeruginosa]